MISVPETIVVPNNPSYDGMAMGHQDIFYGCHGKTDQKITLVTPMWEKTTAQSMPRFPFIVFVQGSAWTTPDRFFQLPQLCGYAQRGIAVASVTHRSWKKGHPFPAYLEDVKCAIRFLRAHADEYGLDAKRAGIFGTSSGGNAALLVGLTGDDPRYKTEDYAEYSDGVSLVVDCFGPTHMAAMKGSMEPRPDGMEIVNALTSGQDPTEVMQAMSPLLEVRDGQTYPPFLLLHGSADKSVPYAQSEAMASRLVQAGASAKLVRVTGAPHEGSFWSPQVHGIIVDFIRSHI